MIAYFAGNCAMDAHQRAPWIAVLGVCTSSKPAEPGISGEGAS